MLGVPKFPKGSSVPCLLLLTGRQSGNPRSRQRRILCHMKPGSIPVKAGDQVKAGEVMGQIGGSGNVHTVGFHFNLMDGPEWIDAKGLPPLLSNFELVPTAGSPKLIELGNPRSGWVVRPAE